MSNADEGGREINSMLGNYAKLHKDRILCVKSLGSIRYLSAMKYCEFVMGNSSSGIIEAPSFGIPTINIGDRQRGRIKADSIIDCSPEKEDILRAINKALSPSFRLHCKEVINPNGDGNTSKRIISIIKEYSDSHEIDLKKKFYNII